jgi:serine/threonine-protein kinase
MELVNSPILRKLQNLRETRYWQLLIFFWFVGLSAVSIILILDLPRAIKSGKHLSAELPPQPGDAGESGSEQPAAEIVSTKVITRAEKKVRFVGPKQRYRIDKALASGGAGIVYQAEDTVLGRQVALKELLQELADDALQAERFKSEARALAVSNHPNILPVFDLLEEDGHLWLVMELLTGGTLADRIKAGDALDTQRCIEITRGIASGLGFAHEQGFVHRDVKPANILFAEDGHGLILGSPGYMSPEQAAGESVDARSDIYSLGIVLFQMLTSELPFSGDVSAVMAQHITRPAPLPSEVDASIGEGLDALVAKMLAKKPEDRYQSAAELIAALDALALN